MPLPSVLARSAGVKGGYATCTLLPGYSHQMKSPSHDSTQILLQSFSAFPVALRTDDGTEDCFGKQWWDGVSNLLLLESD